MSSIEHQQRIKNWFKYKDGSEFGTYEVASMLSGTRHGGKPVSRTRIAQVLHDMTSSGLLVKVGHAKWKQRGCSQRVSALVMRHEHFDGESDCQPRYF